MSKQAPPSQPDYTGAAREQAQASQDLATQQTRANRPDITTPFATMSWTEGDDGRWSGNLQFTPDQQAALEQQMAIQRQRSELAGGMMDRVGAGFADEPNWDALPGAPDANAARQQAIDAVYGQMSSRLDPQWQRRQQDMDTQLRNQGVMPGTPAYKDAMAEMERYRTDSYDTALRSAVGLGEQAAQGEFSRGLTGRQQAISEMLAQRNLPLNELNALLTGQQVGMPEMPGFMGAGRGEAPNLLGAEQMGYDAYLNAYNVNAANRANTSQGLGMLGMIGGGAFGGPLGAAAGGYLGSSLGGLFSF